ncbi:site-specific integrase [Frankia sp. Cppng1_Ct_nod]|uniref:tyrosine-type recombinase/integrase n=1 Tax=Frankia sp. Cppng1_Ct_nod TaxID=2897162 RepID=UPI001041157F|nr:site-specific integrase [Frankia sp. Cppng1_Ct_nod]
MAKRINGEGTYYQRQDGRWEGAAYMLMSDGTYKRRRVYGKTDEEVRQKLTDLKANSDQGIPTEATGWTVGRFLTYWLEQIVKPACKPRTYQGYEVVVRVHLVPALGKKKLNKLTGADVRLFLRRLENMCLCCVHKTDQKRAEGERRCCAVGRCCKSLPSIRLRQQVHAVLRNALEAAVREELIRRNVAKLVKVSGPKYKVNRGLTVDQARKLLVAAENDRLHALYVLALFLGLRRGELLGLHWSDIDLDVGTLTVRRNLQRVGGELRTVTPKTERSERTIPLLGATADALRRHTERQREERAHSGPDWVETGHVFTSVIGTPIEPDNLRRSWYPLREKIGAEGVRFHDLRHTCVTLLLHLGIPPHTVRDIAGHSAIEVTMTIYAHTSLGQMRDALSKLDDQLR